MTIRYTDAQIHAQNTTQSYKHQYTEIYRLVNMFLLICSVHQIELHLYIFNVFPLTLQIKQEAEEAERKKREAEEAEQRAKQEIEKKERETLKKAIKKERKVR